VVLRDQYAGKTVGRYHGSEWEIPDNCLAWTVVRNPWVRLASWWRSLVCNDGLRSPVHKKHEPEITPPCRTFAEFLQFMIEHRHGDDLEDQRDQRQPQHIFAARQPCTAFVRLENFAEDFAKLPFGKAGQGLGGRRNQSDLDTKPLTHWYDDKAVEMAIHYGVLAECQAFGYPEELP
jgi:hypothetical protein